MKRREWAAAALRMTGRAAGRGRDRTPYTVRSDSTTGPSQTPGALPACCNANPYKTGPYAKSSFPHGTPSAPSNAVAHSSHHRPSRVAKAAQVRATPPCQHRSWPRRPHHRPTVFTRMCRALNECAHWTAAATPPRHAIHSTSSLRQPSVWTIATFSAAEPSGDGERP